MASASGIFITFIFLLICTGLFSASEAALTSISKARLKAIAENNKKAEKALKLYNNYQFSVTTIVVLNNILNILIPTLATVLFVQAIANENLAILISTIVVSIVLIIFGEIIPKLYGFDKNEVFLLTMAPLLLPIIKIATPISIWFFWISSFFKKHMFKHSSEESSLIEIEDELLNIIEESVEDGELTESEEEIIRNAIEFNDKRVEEVLQPKSSIVAASMTEKNAEILKIFQEHKYSRLPIYEDAEDNYVGVITERDFLQAYINSKTFDIKDILRDVKYVPDTLKISTLLPQLQKARMHMAIVIDERATIQGLVTVEDMIEEIVGDIWDEHDDIEMKIWKTSTGFSITGECSISDFNTFFDKQSDITSEETTIAGYIIDEMQKIPKKNDELETTDFRFKIVEVTNNKIGQIAIFPK